MVDVDLSPLLEATPEELKAIQRKYQPDYWALDEARIVLPKGDSIDFRRYPYMRDVYACTHPDIVIIKGAQLGFSTWAICRACWFVTTFNVTVIYTFPTRDLVSEYTAGRINPIIQQTPYLNDRIVDVNSVRLKKFRRDPKSTSGGVSLIYFQGAAQEKDAIAVDADLLVHDEEDKSNAQVIEQYIERITASKYKHRIRLSTPTIPGKGVDKAYKGTDRMKWLVRCPSCSAEFEMRFPKAEGDPRSNIEPHTYREVLEGTPPRYICHVCKTTLTDSDRGAGRWVAERPELGLPRGFQVSQMAAPWISAYTILKAKAETTWEQDFWNLKIGMAWMSGTTAMTRQALIMRATDRDQQQTSYGAFMGVDVGKRLHIVIEDYDDYGKPHVIRIASIAWDPDKDFSELDEFMERYQVSTCVMDREPETGMARRFARRWNRPGMTRVYLCKYKDETANASSREIRYDEPDDDKAASDVAAVKAPRNETLTNVANDLLTVLWLPVPDGSDDYEAFFDHCWNSKRTPQYDESASPDNRSIDAFVWENTGPDHFFHALVYCYLARIAPRAVAPPIHGIITSNRGEIRNPIIPDEEKDPSRHGFHAPVRVQRIG